MVQGESITIESLKVELLTYEKECLNNLNLKAIDMKVESFNSEILKFKLLVSIDERPWVVSFTN